MLFANYTSWLSERFGVEKSVEMIADAGFPAVDISMMKLPDPPFCEDWRDLAKRLNKFAEKRGITYIQAHAPVGKWDYYIENVIPMLPDVIEFAGLVGIPNLVVHPIMRGYYYDDKDAMFAENIEFYKSIAPIAKKHGVKIALENMWQRHRVSNHIGDCIGADPHELVRLHDTLDDPEAFTICLDIGHVAICAREPEDAIRVIGGERLGCIHAHDVDYVSDLHIQPGLGKIRWDRVCRALADVDYKGPFTLEAGRTYQNLDDEVIPSVLKFMADQTRHLADKVEKYKAEK